MTINRLQLCKFCGKLRRLSWDYVWSHWMLAYHFTQAEKCLAERVECEECKKHLYRMPETAEP